MSRRKVERNFVTLALVVAALFLVAACGGGGGGGEQTAGGGGEGTTGMETGRTVTVASDIAYRPFEFYRNGEPVGFDIDLMREIGRRAGFTPEFQNVTFDGIIPGLGSNLYDAAISAITITEERRQQVDFSEPYFNADQSLLVRSDSEIRSVDDLGQATVGVQIGTTGANKANQFQQQGRIAEVRTFDTIEDAFTALENGQVDAVINDLPVSQDKANTSDGRLEVVQVIPTGEQYGIAFPKGSNLVGPVNRALREMKSDGTYAEIYEKWIGRKPEEIP
ncbi:basic amino acid ABC transporter substrate-binding protein [Rubrobacter xylanophilus]|uniref:Basic amino acid ABC transporter substrate-binding protein n=1 Tax=Rubrobacter xylanophilus TaxID=49319 RepID=A0A510HMI4_9ACTN|nr:basic amino acid ABC transporter substrate-binding protein [Rubrobacter xylanophilus]BBL81038.1 basic amino acid ABC transporter substrate-binding protein [Rubrobacter xylanophilus]